MSAALRAASHATVAAWALLLLAELAASPQLVLPEAPVAPAVTARVRPRPEPAVEPRQPAEAPQPEPENEVRPAQAPARAPAARVATPAELARGESILSRGGSFPALSFGYDAFPSFRAYAEAMVALGARFVVVRARGIEGEIDLATGETRPLADAGVFSPRARDYTGEPGLAAVARAARREFGERAVVMMLVPRALDAGLFGALARVLDEHGEAHGELREVRGSYRRGPGGGIQLAVDAAVRRDGTRVPVRALFDLGAIAGT